MQNWSKLGDQQSTIGRQQWPVGRDSHASCVLSDAPHPQILISGGWDKDNQPLNDAWILDVHRKHWKKVHLRRADMYYNSMYVCTLCMSGVLSRRSGMGRDFPVHRVNRVVIISMTNPKSTCCMATL